MRDVDQLRVTEPCPLSWDALQEDESGGRTRFCGVCERHVHDVAKLRRAELERLLAGATGGNRVCLFLTRRPDGTLVLHEEPRRGRMVVAAVARAASFVVAALGALVGCGDGAVQDRSPPESKAVKPARAPSEPRELTPDELEQLRQLGGYTSGGETSGESR